MISQNQGPEIPGSALPDKSDWERLLQPGSSYQIVVSAEAAAEQKNVHSAAAAN